MQTILRPNRTRHRLLFGASENLSSHHQPPDNPHPEKVSMKQTAQFLTGLTAFMLLPFLVENTAQHDALGPVLGLTVLFAVVAAAIFACPVKTRR